MLGSFDSQGNVVIREHRRCCRSRRFTSDFPPQLNGIIHPNEFYRSIHNINRARKMTMCEKFVHLIFWLCILVGSAIFIVGIALVWIPTRALWIALIVTGVVVFLVTCCISLCIFSLINESRRRRLLEAINAESMKYSTRRPVPTRWRLNVTPLISPGSLYGAQIRLIYSIIIDIGRRGDSEMRNDALKPDWNLHEPTSYISQQHPIFPLSYQDLSATISHDQSLFNQEQVHIHSPV